MNRIANVIIIHSRDKLSWFILPWIVVGSSFLINVFIAALFAGKGAIYTGGLSSIYVYVLVGAIVSVIGTFPFAVGFSTRRKDYFFGTITLAIAVSAAWAVLLALLSLIEANLIPNWGVNLHFFHLPYLSDGSIFTQVWTYFMVMLLMYALGFLPASIYQRFGRTGTYTFSGIIFLLLSVFSLVSTRWDWWGTIFGWLAQQSAAMLAGWMVPVVGLCLLASYALLRKATV